MFRNLLCVFHEIASETTMISANAKLTKSYEIRNYFILNQYPAVTDIYMALLARKVS